MEWGSKYKWIIGTLLLLQVPLFFYFTANENVLINIKIFSTVNKTRPRVARWTSAPLRILVWGPPYVGSWIGMPSTGYAGSTCPCYFTTDKTEVDEADAVAFVAIVNDGADSQLPPANLRQSKNPQLRIFVSLESPHRMAAWWQNKVNISSMALLANSDQFNWTMTYRHDSDVPYLFYGETLQTSGSRLSPRQIQKMSSHSDSLSANKLALYKANYLKPNKTRLIAWAVSNCETVSKRSELVKEIQKYVPVDVYGKCGKLKCPDNNCRDYFRDNYKFYLAFENTLCYDYVTEKFFGALHSNVIPIAYGGADYQRLAPPGSYIDAMGFKSVKELVDHLLYLDKNPEEYLKYFMWREKYTIGGNNGWCELCTALNSHSTVQFGKLIIDPNYTKVYKNISDWWYSSGGGSGSGRGPACRFPPERFL